MAAAQERHQSGLLTNMSYKIEQNLTDYIASKICPIVTVANETDDFLKFLKSFWYRNYAKLIPEGDPTPLADYGTETDSYRTKEHGIATRITKRARKNADAIHRLLFNKNSFVTGNILRKRELVTAALMFSATNFTNTSAVSVKWDQIATATIIDDILLALEAVPNQIGVEANTIAVGRANMRYIKRNAQVLASLFGAGGDGPQVVTESMLARFFGVSQFLVGKGKYTTDPEGTAEADVTYTDIWGQDYCWVGYVAPAPAVEMPSAAYTFQAGRSIRQWNETSTENIIVDGKENSDTKLVSADAGYLLTGLGPTT